MKKAIYILFGLLLITGCARAFTDITAVRDPAFKDAIYKHIVIVVPFADLDFKATAEKALQNALKNRGIKALISLEVFPPTRNIASDEVGGILRQNGIDGMLVIALSDYWEQQVYIPQTSSTTGNVSSIGNSIYFNSATSQSGGFYLSKPRIKFECKLFDVKTGQVAWLASTTTKGSAHADFSTLANSLADSMADYLVNEKIVQ